MTRPNPVMLARLVFIVFTLSLLGSCGFHLRGDYSMPERLSSVIVHGGGRDFEEKLSKHLEARGVTVYKLGTRQGLPRIATEWLNFDRSVSTRDSSGRTTGYSYKLDVDFFVADANGDRLLPNTTLVQTRTQQYDPGEVLQLAEEEEFLRDQMEDELILQMLKRFSRL